MRGPTKLVRDGYAQADEDESTTAVATMTAAAGMRTIVDIILISTSINFPLHHRYRTRQPVVDDFVALKYTLLMGKLWYYAADV